MNEELVRRIEMNGEVIELPIPFSVDVIEEELAMYEDSDESIHYKFKALTAKVINVLCNQIRDLQQQVRPKAEWIPIEKEVYSRDKGSEMIVAEYECTRCGRTETDDWMYCRCGAEMTNGSCRYPSKEEFAEILKALEEVDADEPQM